MLLFSQTHTLNPHFACSSIEGEHHIAPVKKVYRTYQKIKRAYGGRVQRMCDVVRTTICFKDIPSLTDCIRIMDTDPDIDILRVKNRYDPYFVSDDGYRDCAMLITSPLFDGFVVEVQLNLIAMYEAKTQGGGHKRYTAMRDERGA